MAAASGAKPIGGFRTAYEFRKWVMKGSTGNLDAVKNASATAASGAGDNPAFLEGLSNQLNKLISSYEQREQELKKKLVEAKKQRANAAQQAAKKRAGDEKKEMADENNIYATWAFNKGRGDFNKKVMAQYNLLKGFKPKKHEEPAYWAMFNKMAQLTAYTKKKDINYKDLMDIEKLQKGIDRLSETLGPVIKEKLEHMDKWRREKEKSDFKWYKSWDDYREDMALFRDKVLDGIKGLGKRMLEGFLHFGIGPLTIGNISKLVLGSLGAVGWVGGAALSGIGHTVGSPLVKGASWLGGKALGGAKALGGGALNTLRAAKAKVGAGMSAGFEESGGADAVKRLEDDVSGYIRSTKSYRDKLLGNMKKQFEALFFAQKLNKGEGGAKEGGGGFGLGSIFKWIAKLPKMIGGMIGNILNTAKGGILKALGGLALGGGKLLGRIGGVLARFALGPGGLIAGAAVGGYAIGTALYKMFDVQILDGIDAVVDGFNKTIEWFKERWDDLTGIYKKGKKYLGKGVDSVKSFFGFGPTKDGQKPAPAAPAPIGGTMPMAVGGGIPMPQGTSMAMPTTAAGAANAMTGNASQADVRKEDIKNTSTYIKKLKGDVDIAGLNPAVQENFLNMAKEYYEKTGKKLQVNSAKRSHASQVRLYQSMPKGMAAKPGTSLHELGYAVDVQSSQAQELDKSGLLKKYGFMRPLAGRGEKAEGWHITPQGIPNVYALAKKSGTPTASSTTAVNEGFSPGPSTTTAYEVPQDDLENNRGKTATVAAASSKVGVSDIATYSSVDQTLFAHNLGVFSG